MAISEKVLIYQGIANGTWSVSNPRCINHQFMPPPYNWSYAVTETDTHSNWLNRFYDAGFRRIMLWMPFGQDRAEGDLLLINPNGSNNKIKLVPVSPLDVQTENYSIEFINPGTPSASLSVELDGLEIKVYLATNSSSVITTTASQVISALNNNGSISSIITASNFAPDNGSGVVTAITRTYFFGSTWWGHWEVNGLIREGINHLMMDHYLRCIEKNGDVYENLTDTFVPVIGQWVDDHPDCELIIYTGNVWTGYTSQTEATYRPDFEEDMTLGERQQRFWDSMEPYIQAGCSVAFDASVSIGEDHWWFELISELRGSGTRVYIESYPGGPFTNLADFNFICDHTHYRNVRPEFYWPEYNNGNPIAGGFMGYLPKESITGEKVMLLVDWPTNPAGSFLSSAELRSYYKHTIHSLLARNDVDAVMFQGYSWIQNNLNLNDIGILAKYGNNGINQLISLKNNKIDQLDDFQVFAWSEPSGDLSEFVQPFARDTWWGSDYEGRISGLANEVNSMVDGQKTLFIQGLLTQIPDSSGEGAGDDPWNLFNHPLDRIENPLASGNFYMGFWNDNAVERFEIRFTELLEDLQAAGLTDLDFWVLDTEDTLVDVYELVFGPNGSGTREAIIADNRWSNLAEQYHLPLDLNLNTNQKIIDFQNVNWALSAQCENNVAVRLIKEYYPNCVISEYGFGRKSQEDGLKCPIENGRPHYYNGPNIGDLQSPPLYGFVGQLGESGTAVYDLEGETGYDKGEDWLDPYVATALHINYARASYRFHAGYNFIPWIWVKSQLTSGSLNIPWGQTDWWEEGVLHFLLSTASTNLLWFNPMGPSLFTTSEDEEALIATIEHMKTLCNNTPLSRSITKDLIIYTSDFFVSASITTKGKVVGRVTFRPGNTEANFTLLTHNFSFSSADINFGSFGVSFTSDM